MGKTKGSVVLSAVTLLKGAKERGRAAVPAHLRKYLDERIVLASWYPEDDLYGLILACAETFPAGTDSVFEGMGASTARYHLEGVYRDVLKRDSASRARMIWRAQHDTGDMTVAEESPNAITYDLLNWEHAKPKYCRVVGGYFAEIHRLLGGTKPTFTHPICRSSGGDRCRFAVSWR